MFSIANQKAREEANNGRLGKKMKETSRPPLPPKSMPFGAKSLSLRERPLLFFLQIFQFAAHAVGASGCSITL